MEKSTNKHYDGSYLRSTEDVLIGLKQNSYAFFKDLKAETIVDLGCGIGRDIQAMSRMLDASNRYLGVDHDEKLLAEARSIAGSDKIEFIQSDAEKLSFKDASVGGLRTERMFQHLIKPEIVLAEIQRVLKKDGKLVILETDWSSLSLYGGKYEEQQKLVRYLVYDKVNNGLAVKNLFTQLAGFGFGNFDISLHPFTLTSLAEANAYIQLETCLHEARTDTEMTLELQQLDTQNQFRCSMNMLMFTAQKL